MEKLYFNATLDHIQVAAKHLKLVHRFSYLDCQILMLKSMVGCVTGFTVVN